MFSILLKCQCVQVSNYQMSEIASLVPGHLAGNNKGFPRLSIPLVTSTTSFTKNSESDVKYAEKVIDVLNGYMNVAIEINCASNSAKYKDQISEACVSLKI